ncbi:MAG: InlB B-repeat-containing protein [Lachnospiraceae bacterium]|nr:InlB B-repeat-containing protein [Lachnospiraceae bacterium]
MSEKVKIRKKTGMLMGLMLLAALFLGMSAQAEMTAAGSQNVSTTGLNIRSITGQIYTTASFSKGITALFFGNINCPDTRNMIARANEMRASGNGKLTIVLMDKDSTAADRAAFASNNPSVIVADGSSDREQILDLMRNCGLSTGGEIALPVTFLVDSSQKIQYASAGLQEDLGAKLMAMLQKLDSETEKETEKETEPETEPAKAELNLTLKVIYKKKPVEVTNTYYIGLFDDEELTRLRYRIPMIVVEEGGTTKKLKVDVSKMPSGEATFYLAELDQNKRVMLSGNVSGYNIKLSRKSVTLKSNTSVSATVTNTVLVGGQAILDLKIDQKNIYKVVYKLNGGKNNSDNPVSYAKGKKVVLKKPSRKGYAFAGWYSDSKLTKKVSGISTKDTKKKTFYAKWKKIIVDKASVAGVSSSQSGKIAVSLKKMSSVKGYQIVVASDSKFKKVVKKITVSKTKTSITSLPKGKTVYVRARAYTRDSSGGTVYGKYSAVTKIKVKK